MNWHYAQYGQQIGPVTDEQLLQLFKAGKINQETLVWHEGMPDWAPYRAAIAPSNQPAAGQPPTAGTGNPQGENEVVCSECGKLFPVGETIRMGLATVCAECKPVFLQKLSEGAQVAVVAPVDMNYAGFWIRFAAKFLDGLILGVPFMIVYFIAIFPAITSSIHNNGKPPEFSLLPALLQVGFLFVRMGYDIFFLGKYGATPGKMVCKLQVITSEGGKISYPRATGRFFSEILSGMICYIGYIMVAFDDQKRALHDHICNTRVIQK